MANILGNIFYTYLDVDLLELGLGLYPSELWFSLLWVGTEFITTVQTKNDMKQANMRYVHASVPP